jgi:hypothetical protein
MLRLSDFISEALEKGFWPSIYGLFCSIRLSHTLYRPPFRILLSLSWEEQSSEFHERKLLHRKLESRRLENSGYGETYVTS